MYYIIYKITNNLNGKFYIGCHRTKNINDNYMGSGKLLKRAFNKYGIENFRKEILFVFDNPDDMYAKEAEIVNEDFLLEENTYNVNLGGYGGFNYLNNIHPNSKEFKQLGQKNSRLSIKRKYGESYFKEFGKNLGKNTRDNKLGIFSETYIRTAPNSFKGKKHKPETKAIIGQKNSINQSGSKNSQYGTCWITNGKENKKIKKEELDLWLEKGYNKGRNLE